MCVDAVFVHPSGPCPKCGVTLRKNLYRLLQFEDSRVEIEVDIRKKVLKECVVWVTANADTEGCVCFFTVTIRQSKTLPL